jgi:hypothetical protein
MALLSHSYSEAALRSVADDLCTKLPRELRDIVYSYVCDQRKVAALPLPQLLEPCHRVGICLGQSCICKILPADTPCIVNKAVVGQQIAGEALEWVYNSDDLTIGSPDQFPKFFTENLFGAGVRAKDHQLRKLTSVITIPQQYVVPKVADFKFFFTLVLMGEFRNDFMLNICVRHTHEGSLGVANLLELKKPLVTAYFRMLRKKINVKVSHEQLFVPAWDVTKSLAPAESTIILILCDIARKVHTGPNTMSRVKLNTNLSTASL